MHMAHEDKYTACSVMYGSAIIVMRCNTVEPHLMDTPQQQTPTIKQTILKVLTVIPFTSVLKQPLNSGHPATLYNGHFSRSQLHANNSQQS